MKLTILRKLFKLYGVDPADLIFTLRDENDDSTNTESTGTRFELRRKYWTYALNIIKSENTGRIFPMSMLQKKTGSVGSLESMGST